MQAKTLEGLAKNSKDSSSKTSSSKSIPIFDADDPQSFPKPPIEIIKGILYQQVLTTLWGAPGSGKSHIALDLACMIAQKYPVIYVAAEAPYEIGLRAKAWKQYHSTTLNHNLKVWTEPVLLMKTKSVNFFIESVHNIKPVAIFIDPLAQCFLGGNENETEDMGVVTFHLNYLCRILQTSVCIVTHTGWSSVHERGSSVLRAATRISLSVKQSDGTIKLRTEKMNAGKPLEDRYFSIEQINENEMETVLIPATKESISINSKLTDKQRQVLESLSMTIFTDGVLKTELASYVSGAFGISVNGVYKIANILVDKGLAVTSKAGKLTISEEGIDTIDSLKQMDNLTLQLSTGKFNWTLSNYPSLSKDYPQIIQELSTPDYPIIQPPPSIKGVVDSNLDNVDKLSLIEDLEEEVVEDEDKEIIH